MPGTLAAIRDIEPRSLSGRFWHQGPTGRPLLSFPSQAPYDARYHRAGGPGTWYASSKERAAWAELFRHHQSSELSPFEVRRRVGRVRVDGLRVLDLTDPSVRDRLGVVDADLVDDDLTVCQTIADEARSAGFDAILAPSAALPGETTLAVFRHAARHVVEEHSRIQRPPRTLLRLLPRVRRRLKV